MRTKKRKKLQRPLLPIEVPMSINERWSMDFFADQLSTGRRFRILNVVDEYSREVIGQLVSTSISGVQASRYLDRLAETRGLPRHIIVDNGTEFTRKFTLPFNPDSHKLIVKSTSLCDDDVIQSIEFRKIGE